VLISCPRRLTANREVRRRYCDRPWFNRFLTPVDPRDEGRHPQERTLWSESYYAESCPRTGEMAGLPPPRPLPEPGCVVVDRDDRDAGQPLVAWTDYELQCLVKGPRLTWRGVELVCDTTKASRRLTVGAAASERCTGRPEPSTRVGLVSPCPVHRPTWRRTARRTTTR